MADGDLYNLTVHYNTKGGPVSLSQGYGQDGGTLGKDTLLKACERFAILQTVNLFACLSTECELAQIEMTGVTDLNAFPGFLIGAGTFGEIAGEALPNNMAALISQKTASGSSKNNGRLYVAGIPETEQFGGELVAGQVTLLQAFADSMTLDLNPDAPEDAVFTPVVISRFFENLPRNVPIGFSNKTSIAKISMRQQRRRTTRRLGYA